ncbi:MAG TPA: uridine kinase [Deltaproteobacteria bacterium]|nr:uridine kinase [Deltaproteobacteria bacterium]
MGHIIAVAGPIGSGKSTLVREIARGLGNASILHYDRYEHATHRTPAEMIQWMRAGADFNDFALPGLTRDLSKLKNGVPVVNSADGETIAAERFTVFEMPLGRAHRQAASFIDLLLWIDIPFDIALARKAGEYARRLLAEGDGTGGLNWLAEYFGNYLSLIRPLMKIQEERVRPGADLVLDGLEEPRDMACRAVEAIGARFANNT